MDDWTAEEAGEKIQDRTIFNAYKKMIGVQSLEAPVYFVAPRRFLGNQLASFGQKLKFKLKIGQTDGKRIESTYQDVIIEGGRDKLSVSTMITAQNNPTPSDQLQSYQFILHHHPSLQWQPELTSSQFMSILNNVTAIKIRGSYLTPGEGYIDSVELETALVKL